MGGSEMICIEYGFRIDDLSRQDGDKEPGCRQHDHHRVRSTKRRLNSWVHLLGPGLLEGKGEGVVVWTR